MGQIQAQRGTVASGGDDLGSQGFVSFSIGQVDYSTNIGFEGTIITEGLQQPYVITEIENYTTMGITLFPNLTSDFVTLSILNGSFEGMYYAFYDVQGKLIKKEKIMESQTSISVEDLASAIYLIKIYSDSDKKIKSFKIIKNK
ncbi:MAG: T9SS type A sorting domain-containing protein [Bacteroidota bacterium]